MFCLFVTVEILCIIEHKQTMVHYCTHLCHDAFESHQYKVLQGHAVDMKVLIEAKTKVQRQKQKQTRNSLGNMESLHLLLWLHSARTCLQVWGSFSWFDEPVEQKVEFHMGCPSGYRLGHGT